MAEPKEGGGAEAAGGEAGQVEQAHVDHPLLAPDRIERRDYQVALASAALARSTLVVLPTGMGKTVVALLVLAQRLAERGGKALFLAPTKPLVEQHARFLNEHLLAQPQAVFTGEVRPDDRAEQWGRAKVVVATPQVVENDLIAGRYGLDDVAVLVFDEAHRAVGNYAYVFIGERYRPVEGRLVLGITASPGHNAERVLEVAENLGIRGIEVRTETDPDVEPYLQETDIEWVRVSVPREMERVIDLLSKMQDRRVATLRKGRFVKPKGRISKRDLLSAQRRIQDAIKRADRDEAGPLYQMASTCAAALKVGHALELAETQGATALKQYIARLEEDTSKAAKRILDDERMRTVRHILDDARTEHPKMAAAVGEVQKELRRHPDGKVILFAHYRDTAELLVSELKGREGVRPVRFVGQASRGGDKGLTQKEQTDVLEAFRRGDHNVLVATSVAEEGLDIPSCDLVLFYEPIPSEIRTIQRRGRTGRQEAGRVVMLITRDTRDEAYYWTARGKEKRMRDQLHALKRKLADRLEVAHRGIHPAFVAGEGGQLALEAFGEGGPKGAAGADQAGGPGAAAREEPEGGRGAAATGRDDDGTEGTQEQDDREGGPGPGLTVWVDSREFKGPVARELARAGVKVEPRQFAAGDYVLSDRVAVERKTGEDLAQSLLDKRLFPQLKSLVRRHPSPVLVLEGKGLFTSHRVHENAILGALASIATDFRVPIVPTDGPEETARLLVALAKREAKAGRGPPDLRESPGVLTDDERLQYVMEGLPGVSATLAVRLLAHFGTLERIARADPDALKAVEGIGDAKAEAIHGVFRTEYRGRGPEQGAGRTAEEEEEE